MTVVAVHRAELFDELAAHGFFVRPGGPIEV